MPSPVRAETMKVAANATRSVALLTSAKSVGFSTRSILLTMRIFGRCNPASRSRRAPVSSSRPRLASISAPTMSASPAPIQAPATMARSSRRRGAKIPGVSTKTSWACACVAMPRSKARVVCTLWETIATLAPTSALISVDLPTLGAPISATNPQRRAAGAPLSASTIEAFRRHPLAGQHDGGGRLLGGALGAAGSFRRQARRQLDGDAELGVMVWAGARDLAIGRGRQPLRLRPFLQHGLGVAQGPLRRAHALLPQPRDQGFRRRVAAIDEDGADQRLAHVGEDGEAAAPAGIALGGAEPDGGAELDRARHVGAGLLAHQIGEPPRQFPLVGAGKGPKQHVRDDQAEHVIAQEFEP